MGWAYVSICQADYWLPQVCWLTSLPNHVRLFQSAKQITGFPKYGVVMVAVRLRLCFNLPSRLLASPRHESDSAGGIECNCFNLPSRLLASPRPPVDSAPAVNVFGFNLPSRLLASPSRSLRCAAGGVDGVSICQADYWLPQGPTLLPR